MAGLGAMTAAIDLTLALWAEGIRGDLIALFFAVAFTSLPILFVVAVAGSIYDTIRSRREARERAMRRHPSARTADYDSERARKYHESNQFGR